MRTGERNGKDGRKMGDGGIERGPNRDWNFHLSPFFLWLVSLFEFWEKFFLFLFSFRFVRGPLLVIFCFHPRIVYFKSKKIILN